MTYFERITDPVLILTFVFLCATSFFFSLFFILIARYIFDRRGEKDLNAIQSAHDDIVPRLGGLAVFLTIFLFFCTLNSEFLPSIFLADFDFDFGSISFLMVSVFPIFFIGLIEDLGYYMAQSNVLWHQ